MSKGNPTSFRLSPKAQSLALKMSKKLGVSKTAVVELALRRLAEKELSSKKTSSSSSSS
jgi:hypothetical protein